ncbi:glycosyltransferase family 4 protein [Salmonirosea aquatica]|uniref:Glycosyltransferase n=1 Tax=Salmonirosea aquatica TaxID=2654236 RepID=A0A7C9FFL8_9BACT|nr:glycosyltransferase [Cytophagaceae bacterium SJW1-29]
MRILVIHNQLWAHYKSILFEEIHRELRSKYPDSEFLVAQIALYESTRASMVAQGSEPDFAYPYRVLFERSLDTVTLSERIQGLFRVFHSFRPDVLNITGYYDWAQVLLLFYAKTRGLKVVISSESSMADRTRSTAKEFLKKMIFKCTDAFFCFGQSTVSYLRALGVPESKIAVRRGAVVDNDRVQARFENANQRSKKTESGNRNFIYVGRLAPEKNVKMLLEAYQDCIQSDKSPNWGLIVVGDGPLLEVFREYAVRNGLSQVQFTGGIPWAEVPDYLAQASVLVLPSLSEPWGLVVNEALVCGMPVIVSEKCGCAEDLVSPNQNGFVFDPTDKVGLVRALQYYRDNPGAIERHGTSSKKIIAPFSPGNVAREMVQQYRVLVQ